MGGFWEGVWVWVEWVWACPFTCVPPPTPAEVEASGNGEIGFQGDAGPDPDPDPDPDPGSRNEKNWCESECLWWCPLRKAEAELGVRVGVSVVDNFVEVVESVFMLGSEEGRPPKVKPCNFFSWLGGVGISLPSGVI